MANDKINILVVDDLPENLLVHQSILEELGQSLITAGSGEEALRRMLEYDFAVILLDVNMPGMDGLETAAILRRRKKTAHTPIIFITAFADEMHTARGYSLGAVDYILSPVIPEILRTKVKVFVDLFRMHREVKRQADERVALAQEQAARAAAEEATRRSTFLAEASRILARSLDADATLRDLLQFTLPFLGDLGAITLVDDQGRIQQTELAWVDTVGRICTRSPASPAELDSQWLETHQRVLRDGRPRQLPENSAGATPALNWKVLNPELASAEPSPDFKLSSLVILPLVARARVLGALSLAMGHTGRSFGSPDRVLAEDLAGRLAIAIDNARLYQGIQEADRRKNEFLSMLAHELRNPLAPIRNAVHILRVLAADQPELEPVQDMIDRQVQHLVRLVDDLLDVSRITQGKIRLQPQPVEVALIVSHALETTRSFIEARKQDLKVVLPPEPLLVTGDLVRLTQVVGNLLNNAAKYTSEGGTISLTAERIDSEAIIRIRDTGVGIPEDMLASIFEPFTQIDRSLDRSLGGLGIGLTLVRRLVEMHGGHVQAFSAGPDLGSEFVVRLPALAEKPTRSHSPNGTAAPLVNGSSCRVLVVDDNADGADSLALMLEIAGHQVRVCYDGPAALAAADAFQPEFVLLDIGLPNMDGYEVARRLRDRQGHGQPVLVALTGYGQEEDVRRSREAGFHRHLVKPADLADLTALFSSPPNGSGQIDPTETLHQDN